MGHLAFDSTGKVHKGTPDAWLPVAAQIADYARSFAGRGDIVANVGPDIGGPYATACWSPRLADMDVNTDTCLPGYAPDRVDFHDSVFQLGALPFVGAVTHEAAHARWTCWVPADLVVRKHGGYEAWNQATIEVIIALEESRIEKLAVEKDPSKRAALAQCALSIVLNDFRVNTTLFGASISLALTVGRYAILSTDEVERFRALVAPHLPLGLMPRLEALIREYHALPAHTAKLGTPSSAFFASMFSIAERWLIAIRETAAEIEAEAAREADEPEAPEAESEGAGEPSDGAAGAASGEGAASTAGGWSSTDTAEDDEPAEGSPAAEAGAESDESDADDEPDAESPDEAGEASEDADAEPEAPAEPRDTEQPQPDLRSGIPGEDTEAETVVVIVLDDADADDDADGDADDETAGSLADAIRDAAGEAAMDREGEALDERAEQVRDRKIADRAADKARRGEAAAVADKRHGEGKDGFARYADLRKMTARKPEPGERIAANRLAGILERITFHDRAVRKVDRVLPGGKLRPRAAVARAADRDRGGRAEVAIWRAKERRHTAETPVTVGILTDVSGSMGSNVVPSAVTTYVVSQAVATIEGKCATAIFGNNGYLVNRAYERNIEVQPWQARESTEAFREGALLLDHELSLLDGEGARILIVFTDSELVNPADAEYARTFMRLCKQKSVAVIWCSYRETPVSTFGYGQAVCLTGTAADIANTLGEAVLAAVSKVEASRGA